MLNKMQRKLLIEARKLIADGREEFVCLAISQAAMDLPERYSEPSEKLRAYIRNALNEGGNYARVSTLDEWQRKRRIRHTDSGKRRDRLKWIDWMLGEGADASH